MGSRAVRCWVVTDGKAGMESQCVGLAEALGLSPEIKRIAPRAPWRWLPPQLWPCPLRALGPQGDRLVPPWPDLLIATGRQTVAPAIAVRRAAAGQTFTVQIQDPTVDPSRFDLVVAPAHDGLAGENVVTTLGALHRVTKERLADAARQFRDRYAALPRPLVAVLIGGNNRQYRLSDGAATRLADGLVRLARDSGAGIAVTPSRRTGPHALALIAERLRELAPGSWDIWDGSGDNPYFAMLALADAIVVTGDSVNMVSEACAAARPVYVFDLDGGSAKFDRFHAGLRDRGMTRRFDGRLERWQAQPPDDMVRVVAEIRRRMNQRKMGQSAAARRDAGRGN